MFYIAVVKGSEIKYAEHYQEKVGFDRRAVGLKTQAILEGEGWVMYAGDEPYECVLARINTPPMDGETFEEYQKRIEIPVQAALKISTSKLTPTMPDDSKLDNDEETN